MNKDKVNALEALYAKLPRIACQGLCQDACGPVGLTLLEEKRIEKKVHKKLATLPTGTCNLLRAGRCEAYAVRPLVCRLYGVVENMRCEHGCLPDRFLAKEEGFELLLAAMRISPMTERSEMLAEVASSGLPFWNLWSNVAKP